MILKPVVKGLLTKARKAGDAKTVHAKVFGIFRVLMPRQQAKHATRKYLSDAN